MIKKIFRRYFIIKIRLFIIFILHLGYADAQYNIKQYNLVYDSPTTDSWGSMVCGNGNIASNVWIDEDGVLHFYIGSTDSRDHLGNLLKITKLEVQFSPAIFKDTKRYRQEFDLQTASFNVQTSQGSLRFWVDANNPQVILQVDAKRSINAKVTAHVLRKQGHIVGNMPTTQHQQLDVLVKNRQEDIVLFHRNTSTDFFEKTMKLFGLNKDSVHNPLHNLTWGVHVMGNYFKHVSDSSIATIAPQRYLELRVTVHANQTQTSQEWVDQIVENGFRIGDVPADKLFQDHSRWWEGFWNQSYIEINSNKPADSETVRLINLAYRYNRYVMNIASKGKFPIQFNGSTWQVDTYPDTIHSVVGGKIYNRSADYRLWGNLILWQNMRLPYWTMPASGDIPSMHSLLDFYVERVYPMMKKFTQQTLGNEGVLFTESVEAWGTLNPNIYGWNREGIHPEQFYNVFHQSHYICGLELVNLMLDFVAYTQDTTYLMDKVWPIAKDLTTYYATRYPTDETGKLYIYPVNSLESFTDCVNPTPTVAGLHFVLPRLEKIALSLEDSVFSETCRALIELLPEVPVKNDGKGTIIQVAQEVGKHINVEQPDLYAVYPFRLYSIGTPGLATGRYTFDNPSFSEATQQSYTSMPFIVLEGEGARRSIFSWHQTGVQAAYLGLTHYAKEILVRSVLSNDKRFRFPTFYGPNYDWIPDGDHIAVINMTLQSMLLQCDEQAIYILPAWPKEWNVRFKLHGFYNTIIEGSFENGEFSYLDVLPANRKKDVVYY